MLRLIRKEGGTTRKSTWSMEGAAAAAAVVVGVVVVLVVVVVVVVTIKLEPESCFSHPFSPFPFTSLQLQNIPIILSSPACPAEIPRVSSSSSPYAELSSSLRQSRRLQYEQFDSPDYSESNRQPANQAVSQLRPLNEPLFSKDSAEFCSLTCREV